MYEQTYTTWRKMNVLFTIKPRKNLVGFKKLENFDLLWATLLG